MIQLALLLFGANFVRRQAAIIGLLGVVWGVLGASILIDALDGIRYFPLQMFGALLLAESLATLWVASSGPGAKKAVLYFKGGIFASVALLILSGLSVSNLLMAILFGFAYFVTGLMQITAAWLVRYPRWKAALAGGLGNWLFAVLLFEPYPTHHHGTVPFFIGVTMILGSINTLRTAWRARKLVAGTSVFELFAPQDVLPLRGDAPAHGAADTAAASTAPLVVHVWTPEGSSKHRAVPRPVINRYIAAVDVQGVISTGHAALEVSPAIYISLYPAVDIDRSPTEFLRTMKATRDNDVPGLFQPDYPTESQAWCPSNRQIVFETFNRQELARFWQAYRRHEVYNLTYRNCSSTVAYALEAALDGALNKRATAWFAFLRTLTMPELWIAAQIRRRALTMAWTPGLTLDYARALRAIVHPAKLSWMRSAKRAMHEARRMTH